MIHCSIQVRRQNINIEWVNEAIDSYAGVKAISHPETRLP